MKQEEYMQLLKLLDAFGEDIDDFEAAWEEYFLKRKPLTPLDQDTREAFRDTRRKERIHLANLRELVLRYAANGGAAFFDKIRSM